jgi:hypothetical protein
MGSIALAEHSHYEQQLFAAIATDLKTKDQPN